MWSFKTPSELSKNKHFKWASAFAIFPKVFFKGCWVSTKLSTATFWQKVEKKLPGVKFSLLKAWSSLLLQWMSDLARPQGQHLFLCTAVVLPHSPRDRVGNNPLCPAPSGLSQWHANLLVAHLKNKTKQSQGEKTLKYLTFTLDFSLVATPFSALLRGKPLPKSFLCSFLIMSSLFPVRFLPLTLHLHCGARATGDFLSPNPVAKSQPTS